MIGRVEPLTGILGENATTFPSLSRTHPPLNGPSHFLFLTDHTCPFFMNANHSMDVPNICELSFIHPTKTQSGVNSGVIPSSK
ncbi:hypothetical protein CWM53_20770 [Klebsiella sp. A-Nf5]|nr:hypothetical protein CWM53_20770 [Klebsiella sp. A-Nf5]PJX39698.1 hypothetical protein CWM59_02645 [Klebsiella sp. B-Nf7]PJX50457.1 hypothetical protein CWM60_01700 [Klebsiella sp. C1-16S-Nf17]